MSRDAVAFAAWLCHAALLAAVTLGLATSALPLSARAPLAAAVALPLLLAVPGLRRRRRHTYQWLAFALVAYAGAAAVEVIATSRGSVFATIALLASLIELALLFTLNRAAAPRANRE